MRLVHINRFKHVSRQRRPQLQVLLLSPVTRNSVDKYKCLLNIVTRPRRRFLPRRQAPYLCCNTFKQLHRQPFNGSKWAMSTVLPCCRTVPALNHSLLDGAVTAVYVHLELAGTARRGGYAAVCPSPGTRTSRHCTTQRPPAARLRNAFLILTLSAL